MSLESFQLWDSLSTFLLSGIISTGAVITTAGLDLDEVRLPEAGFAIVPELLM